MDQTAKEMLCMFHVMKQRKKVVHRTFISRPKDTPVLEYTARIAGEEMTVKFERIHNTPVWDEQKRRSFGDAIRVSCGSAAMVVDMLDWICFDFEHTKFETKQKAAKKPSTL